MNLIIIFGAKYLFLISFLIAILYFLTLPKGKRLGFIIHSLIYTGFALILIKLTSIFFYDPRPFVSTHIQPLIKHIADNGFPSDHTVLTMAIALVIFRYNWKLSIFLGILSVCVGIARVLAGVHHPIDIIGGVVIAVVAYIPTLPIMKHYSFFLSVSNEL